MKIGFTERGDGGLDLSWATKVREEDCDGLIVITKNLTPGCADKLLETHASGLPVMLHAGITGMPKSVERGTPETADSLDRVHRLIDRGFPKSRVVLRIDPIVSTGRGLTYPCNVLDKAAEMGLLPGLRVRVSVLDNYPHVRERFRKAFGSQGVLYGGAWNPPQSAFAAMTETLRPYVRSGLVRRFETCAEGDRLTDASVFSHQGCISRADLDEMGLSIDPATGTNPQNRHGCLCLTCKHELLTCKHPCGNLCIYCYWRD